MTAGTGRPSRFPTEGGDVVGGEGCGAIEPQPPAKRIDRLPGDARRELDQDFITDITLIDGPHADRGATSNLSAIRGAAGTARIDATSAVGHAAAGPSRCHLALGGVRA